VAMWACQPIAGRGLAYAKIMQARGKQAGLQFPECGLSYAKIMQARGKQAGLQFPERSLSYAKVAQTVVISKCFLQTIVSSHCRAAAAVG
jgi:hypothetical protein